jgi:hypothetical protein
MARVAYYTSDGYVDFLSFRQKEGEWSLDDLPVKPKAEFEKWGKVAE